MLLRMFIILTIGLFITVSANADEYVHGYTKSDGTHVSGYYRASTLVNQSQKNKEAAKDDVKLAIDLINRGDYPQAKAILLDVSKQDPTYIPTYNAMIYYYQAARKQDLRAITDLLAYKDNATIIKAHPAETVKATQALFNLHRIININEGIIIVQRHAWSAPYNKLSSAQQVLVTMRLHGIKLAVKAGMIPKGWSAQEWINTYIHGEPNLIAKEASYQRLIDEAEGVKYTPPATQTQQAAGILNK